MHRDNDRYKIFSRRAFLLLGGNAILLSGLVGRMYHLQVVEGERYKTLADDNRINLKLIAPSRGQIVDRFGQPIAVNRQNYRAILVPENVLNIHSTLFHAETIFLLCTIRQNNITLRWQEKYIPKKAWK